MTAKAHDLEIALGALLTYELTYNPKVCPATIPSGNMPNTIQVKCGNGRINFNAQTHQAKWLSYTGAHSELLIRIQRCQKVLSVNQKLVDALVERNKTGTCPGCPADTRPCPYGLSTRVEIEDRLSQPRLWAQGEKMKKDYYTVGYDRATGAEYHDTGQCGQCYWFHS